MLQTDPAAMQSSNKRLGDVDPAVMKIIGDVHAKSYGLAGYYYKLHPDEFAQATKDAKTVADYRSKQLTPGSAKNILFKNIAAECPKVSADLVKLFFAPNIALLQYKDDLPYDFTYTYNMQKTDNGWQIAQ